MSKFFSLLRAAFSQDMNVFSYKVGQKSSRAQKIALPLILGAVVMYSIGTYAFTIGKVLSPLGLGFVTLTLFFILTTIIAFIEGIYKSGSILFDSKDNDLLLSLPLRRHQIFAVRVLKLTLFQLLFNFVFLFPAFVAYAILEQPSFSFYPVAIITLLLLPLIPTSLAALIGSVTRNISVRFRAQKVVQAILLLVVFFAIIVLSLNFNNLIAGLAENASSINDLLCQIYYPAGLFVRLIQDFQILNLLVFIAINILPFVLVIWLGSRSYFKVISRSRHFNSSASRRPARIVRRAPFSALVHKELSRFFSTTVYMFNTLPGVFILPVLTFILCINSESVVSAITNIEGLGISAEQIYGFLPKLFLLVVGFIVCTTSITSSSISIEGKSFNITKTLPISVPKLLFAKVLSSVIIVSPLVLLSTLIFAVRFQVSAIESILMLLFALLLPILIAIIGLILNLKYPKMNATSDTEVIKQSMSVAMSMLFGLIVLAVFAALIVGTSFFTQFSEGITLLVLGVVTFLMWRFLVSYGQKRFPEIEA